MGEWKDKVEGKAKEAVGAVTGDESKEMEGKTQHTWGSVQGAAKDVGDTVGSAVDRLRKGGSADDRAGDGNDRDSDDRDTGTP